MFISEEFVASLPTAAVLSSTTGKTCLELTQQIVPILLTHCRFSFPGSMMNRMSFSETIFLFFLALIIFGPKKLPEIARQIGKYMNEFKRASNEFKAQIEQEISHLEVEKRQTILPPSPPPEGATSRKLDAAPAENTAAEAEVSSSTHDAVDDEPLFAAKADAESPSPAAAISSTASSSDSVTAPTSQESHV